MPKHMAANHRVGIGGCPEKGFRLGYLCPFLVLDSFDHYCGSCKFVGYSSSESVLVLCHVVALVPVYLYI